MQVKLPARRGRVVFRGDRTTGSDDLAAYAADSSTDSEMPDIEFIDAPYAL